MARIVNQHDGHGFYMPRHFLTENHPGTVGNRTVDIIMSVTDDATQGEEGIITTDLPRIVMQTVQINIRVAMNLFDRAISQHVH